MVHLQGRLSSYERLFYFYIPHLSTYTDGLTVCKTSTTSKVMDVPVQTNMNSVQRSVMNDSELRNSVNKTDSSKLIAFSGYS